MQNLNQVQPPTPEQMREFARQYPAVTACTDNARKKKALELGLCKDATWEAISQVNLQQIKQGK